MRVLVTGATGAVGMNLVRVRRRLRPGHNPASRQMGPGCHNLIATTTETTQRMLYHDRRINPWQN